MNTTDAKKTITNLVSKYILNAQGKSGADIAASLATDIGALAQAGDIPAALAQSAGVMNLIGYYANTVKTATDSYVAAAAGSDEKATQMGIINTAMSSLWANFGGTSAQAIGDTAALYSKDDATITRYANNLLSGVRGMVEDVAMQTINALIASHSDITFTTVAPTIDEEDKGDINFTQGKTVTDTVFSSGISLGDLSWLIYKPRLDTNTAMSAKWNKYSDIDTPMGSNLRTYVNKANKQVAITLEGTMPDATQTNLWIGRDGLADVESFMVTPAQMREGYEALKTLVADVQHKFGTKGYGLVLAGHSLGGMSAQMLSGMYFIDTGVALPTIAEAGAGMLSTLKLYAEEQLLAGNTIHLPTGGTYKLTATNLADQATEAKTIVDVFKAQDFSNVVNLITTLDPIGNMGNSADPLLDQHVGVNISVPWLLTAREELGDAIYEIAKVGNGLAGLMAVDLHVSRFDRHEPDQSDALWSGTAPGVKVLDADGNVVNFGTTRKIWDGSNLSAPEVKISDKDITNTIKTLKGKDTFVMGNGGNDTILGNTGGDILSGGIGNDKIDGGASDDYLAGDDGDDTLLGGIGSDILYGINGNDLLDGGVGSDILAGGAGNDILTWSAGNDILLGNEGNDTFLIKGGANGNAQIKWDRAMGLNGNDYASSNDYFSGTDNFGTDEVKFEGSIKKNNSILFNFADELTMGQMSFTTSEDGKDITMTDSIGTNSVKFTNAFKNFTTGSIDFLFTNGSLYANDEIYHVVAGKGIFSAIDSTSYKMNPLLSGEGVYSATTQSNMLKGDFLIGSDSKDMITGGVGKDLLFGGNNNDKLSGGYGNDWLIGGAGNDTLTGGDGTDIFEFSGKFGKDIITDIGNDDILKFDGLEATTFTTSRDGNNLVIGYTSQDSSHTASSVTINSWYTGDQSMSNTFFIGKDSYHVGTNGFIKN